MAIPERLHELVTQLGEALVHALATDEQCRRLAQTIQAEGFDLAVMLEATLALRKHESSADDAAEPGLETNDAASALPIPPDPWAAFQPPEGPGHNRIAVTRPEWSEEDKAFLHTFRISLD